MKKTLILTLSLLLVVSVGSFVAFANSQNNEDGNVVRKDQFEAPSVTDNDRVDVSWEIDPKRPWLIFEIKNGKQVEFGKIRTAGTYSADTSTKFIVKTNWQGKVKIDSAIDSGNTNDAVLKVDEQHHHQSGINTFSYNHNYGYKSIDKNNWQTLAEYSHSGEWVDWTKRNSNTKLVGHFSYKLEVPSGTDTGNYDVKVKYRAVCL